MRTTIVTAAVIFGAFLFGFVIGQGNKTTDSEVEHFRLALRQSQGNQIVMRRQLMNFDRVVRSTIIAVWVDSQGDTNMTMRSGDSAATFYRVRSK